jgi:hypothetical protein
MRPLPLMLDSLTLMSVTNVMSRRSRRGKTNPRAVMESMNLRGILAEIALLFALSVRICTLDKASDINASLANNGSSDSMYSLSTMCRDLRFGASIRKPDIL